MSKFNYVTISSTVNKARMESCSHEDGDVETAFYGMVRAVREHMTDSRLYDITIRIDVSDVGEAISTEEPTFYLNGEKVE